MSMADAIREILDEEFAEVGFPESAVERLVALHGERYEWGTRKTWTPRYGGHTEDHECSSERDARDRVTYWESTTKRQGASERLASFQVIRRTVGPWELAP